METGQKPLLSDNHTPAWASAHPGMRVHSLKSPPLIRRKSTQRAEGRWGEAGEGCGSGVLPGGRAGVWPSRPLSSAAAQRFEPGPLQNRRGTQAQTEQGPAPGHTAGGKGQLWAPPRLVEMSLSDCPQGARRESSFQSSPSEAAVPYCVSQAGGQPGTGTAAIFEGQAGPRGRGLPSITAEA